MLIGPYEGSLKQVLRSGDSALAQLDFKGMKTSVRNEILRAMNVTKSRIASLRYPISLVTSESSAVIEFLLRTGSAEQFVLKDKIDPTSKYKPLELVTSKQRILITEIQDYVEKMAADKETFIFADIWQRDGRDSAWERLYYLAILQPSRGESLLWIRADSPHPIPLGPIVTTEMREREREAQAAGYSRDAAARRPAR